MKNFILGLVITAFATLSLSFDALAQQTTLFDSHTWTSGNLVSSEISNTSNPANAIKVIVHYEDITGGQGQGLKAVLEQEIVPGVWVGVAAQNEFILNPNIAPFRTVVLEPSFVSNPGEDIFIDLGAESQRISMYDGTPGGRLRVVISTDGTTFTSATVSVYIELFSR